MPPNRRRPSPRPAKPTPADHTEEEASGGPTTPVTPEPGVAPRRARPAPARRRPRPSPRPSPTPDDEPDATEPDNPADATRTDATRTDATEPDAAEDTEAADDTATTVAAATATAATAAAEPAAAPRRTRTATARTTGTARKTPVKAPASTKAPAATKAPMPATSAERPSPSRPGAGARTRAKTRVGEPAEVRPAAGGKARSRAAGGRSADTTAGADHTSRMAPVLRRWALVIVLVVMIAALAGVDGWLAVSRPDRTASRPAREALLAAAKDSTAMIVSYDYRRIDSDINSTEDRLTGAYKSQYRQAMLKTVKPKAVAIKAIVAGQVSSAGVETVSKDSRTATVLVLGQLNVTSSTQTQVRPDVFRVRVTMQRVGSAWLVSKIDLLA